MILKTFRWLRREWKPALIHTSIVAAFLLFCLFFSGPLFERFEVVAGESGIQNIHLPPETEDVKYGVHELSIGSHIVEVRGWAFIDGHSSENTSIYLVLESEGSHCIFDTMTELRTDVTSAFGSTDFNLDRSGFMCYIPSRKITRGEHVLGIYIKRGDVEAFQRTDVVLTRSAGGIELVIQNPSTEQ